MTSLREIQTGFAEAVRHSRNAESFARQVHAGSLSGARRLQIYRNNYYASLTGALEATYPALLRLVGDDFFRQTARSYVDAYPSVGGDIHDYGHRFGEFLDRLPGMADYAYLGDVARLEWAYHSVFHAALCPAMDLEGLSVVEPRDYGRLRFDLQPAARLIFSRFPVLRIWQANRADWVDDQPVSLDEGAIQLLVLREQDEVAFHPISVGECVLLQALTRGLCLDKAQFQAGHADSQFDLGAALRRHTALGTFTDWRI